MVTKYIEKIRILDHYTNYKGRLFVKTLCDLFNDTAEGQTELLGVDVDTLNKLGQTWMLHRLHICISKMPHKEEDVLIETWPSGVDRLFALRDYRVLRGNGELLVNATSEWMAIDLNRRRPVRLSPQVIELSTCHDIEKLELGHLLNEKELPENMPHSRCFTATFDNIDFNGHVTQASYMRWITNSLSFEFQKNHILMEVEVVYEHEIMPDSSVISYYSETPTEDGVVVCHRLMDDKSERVHCVAKTVWKVHKEKRVEE